MDGHHGPLEISDLVELVARNAYRPNVRWITSRWGPRNGAPTESATLLVGDWLFDSYGNLKRDHETAYNVTTPFIPEYTIKDPETDRISAVGWRSFVIELVQDRVIRPSREVEKLLGRKECDDARHAARIMA